MSIGMIVTKNSGSFDMSRMVESVKWSGRRGAAARQITVTFIDDDGYGHERTGIDVEQGHTCVFSWKGEELFKGMFMRQTQSKRKVMPVVAYDNGIRLAGNTDSFVYTNATAGDIFSDVCARFSIPIGEMADTGYQIPELPKPKTTGYDVVCDALSQTYQATGVRYYPLCKGEQLCLIERRENILQWVIETGVNLESYQLTKSIESVKTRIKLLSKEGTVLAEASKDDLESKIGMFQDVVQVNDTLNEAQLTQLVNTTLEEKSIPERALGLSCTQGMTDVITGVGVFVIIQELGISKTYYVEQDTHIFTGNHHRMELKLVGATDAAKAEEQREEADDEIKMGDVVGFSGGNHYHTSVDTTPVGDSRTAGKAKVTNIAKGAAHEYHVIGGAYTSVEGNSNVYGWVDAGQVSK